MEGVLDKDGNIIITPLGAYTEERYVNGYQLKYLVHFRDFVAEVRRPVPSKSHDLYGAYTRFSDNIRKMREQYAKNVNN